uniref:methenyltetrahydrofolate cyclohydrolase n=1 Tax=Amphilophus citrinellus TaxID=61819 RepID=A0A3Q0QR65_AMPCI
MILIIKLKEFWLSFCAAVQSFVSFGPTFFHNTVYTPVISLSESQYDLSLLLPTYFIVSSDLFVTPIPRQEAVVISGKKLARQIRDEVRADVEEWVSAGHRRPHLSVILVGDNPASHSYVVNKARAAADVGISSETILKHSDISEEELLDLIDKLNTDPRVDGLLVQLPLPGTEQTGESCTS